MSIIDLSHLFSTLYAGLKLGKEPQNGVCQIITAFVAVGTLIALACRLGVIKATLDNLFGLTSWALDAVWPAQIADSLITLNIIDEILDIDLHRWTPVRVWKWDVLSVHHPQIP